MHIKQKCMKSLSLSLPLSSLNNKVIIHLLIIATLLHLYWRVPVFTQVTLTVSLWNVFASISQERKQKHWEIKWMNWITYLRIPGLLLESGTLTPRTYNHSTLLRSVPGAACVPLLSLWKCPWKASPSGFFATHKHGGFYSILLLLFMGGAGDVHHDISVKSEDNFKGSVLLQCEFWESNLKKSCLVESPPYPPSHLTTLRAFKNLTVIHCFPADTQYVSPNEVLMC